LVLFVDVDVKKVALLGREYPWPRPDGCPSCRGRIWGHGFVLAYFAELVEGVLIRRYRCPDCRTVFRLRPLSHWSRFQTSVISIRDCLKQRLTEGHWRIDWPRSRQGHWLRSLKRQSAMRLGFSFSGSLLDAFDRLVEMGFRPVSRSMKRGTAFGFS
jgi:hypothetical protein